MNLNPKEVSREISLNERAFEQDSLQGTVTISQEFVAPNSLQNEIRPSSATSKRSSSLKRTSNQCLNRVKSPKSVSFNIDQEKHPTPLIVDGQKPFTESILPINVVKEIPTDSTTPPMIRLTATRPISDVLPDLFQQHHHEITNKTNIGYQMGK